MIKITNLTKTFNNGKNLVLKDVSLEVQKGELITLVGTSGCGKTTLLKTINQLIVQDSGTIEIDDQDVSKLDSKILRRQIGYVIQKIGLFDHLTVGENIAIVPKILKWDKEKISQRIDDMLNLVNLDPATYRHRHPRELSGGQQQRVGIARALAADPDILLMDEPFGAIDAINRVDLQDQLLTIQKATHKTILFVTHDLSEAFKLGSRILIMDKGEIQQFAKPLEILRNPANDFVKSFLAHNGSLQSLSFIQAKDFMTSVSETSSEDSLSYRTNANDVLLRLVQGGLSEIYLHDEEDKIVGRLSLKDFSNVTW